MIRIPHHYQIRNLTIQFLAVKNLSPFQLILVLFLFGKYAFMKMRFLIIQEYIILIKISSNVTLFSIINQTNSEKNTELCKLRLTGDMEISFLIIQPILNPLFLWLCHTGNQSEIMSHEMVVSFLESLF